MGIFKDSLFNPFPEFSRFRGNSEMSNIPENTEVFSKFAVQVEDIPKLPFISKNHFTPFQVEQWKRSNPI